MYKKLTFAFTFISFLMVISCAKPEEKAWRDVASIDEILGEWEGILYIRHSEEPDLLMLEMPVTLSISTDNNQNYIYEMTADYEQVYEQILDAFIKYAMIDDDDEVYLTKDGLWEGFISILEYTIYSSEFLYEKYYNSEFLVEKYYIIIYTDIPFEERDTFDCDNYQLDQSGDRLKWLYGDIVPKPFIAVEEVILQRRE